MKKIFIITGEPSGDKLASKVISKLQKKNPNIEYSCVGGAHLNSLRIKSTLNSINNYPADVSLMSFTTDKPSISNAVSIGFFNPPMTGGMR